MKCELCGKTARFGHHVSHSKRHSRRRWIPNIHPATIYSGGKAKHVYLCTRCLRSQHKAA